MVYAAGIGALYGDDYKVAATFFFAGIAWIVAKALSWEETRGHPNRGSISVLVLILGIVALGASFSWILHRGEEPTVNQPPAPTALIPVSIKWTDPEPINEGTPLSNKQLNAMATVDGKEVGGTYIYNPTVGATLAPGTLTLSVSFTPSDTSKYLPASKTVALIVQPKTRALPHPLHPIATKLSLMDIESSGSFRAGEKIIMTYTIKSNVARPFSAKVFSSSAIGRFFPDDVQRQRQIESELWDREDQNKNFSEYTFQPTMMSVLSMPSLPLRAASADALSSGTAASYYLLVIRDATTNQILIETCAYTNALRSAGSCYTRAK